MNEIISGVEILSSTEVITELAFSWSSCFKVFFIILAACVISGVLATVVATGTEGATSGLRIGLRLGIIFGLIIGLIAGIFLGDPTYETNYQVTIDDSVSVNEFSNRYEIIKIEGKLYTVRDKTESALAS